MANKSIFYLNNMYSYMENWLEKNYWAILEIVLIIIGCYLLTKLISHTIERLHKRAQRTSAFWDDALTESLARPLKVSVWLIGFTFIFDAIDHEIKINILKFSPIIRSITIIGLITWIAISFTAAFEKRYIKTGKNTKSERFAADLASKVFKFVVISIAALATLGTLGFNISGLIALGGIAGGALAFASQSLLSNFFGTAIIYLDKPFIVGENIFIKGEDLRGTVEEIGWRITMLRTQEQFPVYVQNSVFSRDSIINYSRLTHRKIVEKLGITTLNINQLKPITEDVRDFLVRHDDIDNDYKIVVALSEFGPDFIEMHVEAIIKLREGIDFLYLRQNIMIGVFNIFKDHECQVVFSNDNKNLLARV